MEQQIFTSVTRGFSRLLMLNLFSKLITFVLNTLVIRAVHPEAKGLERTFEAVVNTALFLQREALRSAAQKQKPFTLEQLADPRIRFAQLITLGWLMVPWGILWTLFACLMHVVNTSGEQYQVLGSLNVPLVIYATSIVVETLAEPGFLFAQNLLLFDLQVRLEGLALLTKTGVTAILLWRYRLGSSAEGGALVSTLCVFAVAQLCYSLVLCVGYHSYLLWRRSNSTELRAIMGPSTLALLPHRVRGSPWINWKQFQHTIDLWVETFLRCGLQESEKWVMMHFVVLADQGAYAAVANLGSLVARMGFKFVEDVSQTAWSKLLGEGDLRPTAVHLSAQLYSLLLRLMLLIGIVFIVFGIPYSQALLFVLYSYKWLFSVAPFLLQCYCPYILLMGLNGIAEAFVRATASHDALNRFKSFQLLCGVVYIGTMYVLAQRYEWGPAGVIAANCAASLMRWIYCIRYAFSYFHLSGHGDDFRGRGLAPGTIVVSAICAAVTYGSWHMFPLVDRQSTDRVALKNLVIHIGLGAVSFFVFCVTTAVMNRELFNGLKKLWRSEGID
eukprot:TRINITY_DN24758_c0_g1_i1.p1 TRINITY_DN24758_c0_g1~~TRINITY_DN24758_c0_g1_i1.p1  ORF type:complete len:568 (+),score=64.56 TRINITY_DN24758_c0_g1_i1:35-1705(+)